MRKIFILKRKRFTVSLIHAFCILLIFFLSGCGGGGDDNLFGSPGTASDESSGTGSAVFTVTWHDNSVIEDSENSLVTAQEGPVPLSCEDVGVEEIICEVYEVKDGSSTFLTSGGPWDCSLHGETINGIDAGADRTFVLLGVFYGEDNKENILYRGEVSGVTITAGQTTDPIPIHSFPFVPTGVEAKAVSSSQIDLSWNATDDVGVIGYTIYRNGSFLKIVSSILTSDTDLNPSTEYCYTVSAFDETGNESEQSSPSTCATTPEEGPCIYTISPTSRTVPSSGGTDTVSVTAPIGCDWTATSNSTWITVTSDSSGSGNGTVGYSVDSNSNASSRTGTMTIAGKTFTVTQEGVTCTYSISPESMSFQSDGGEGWIDVTSSVSDCRWTAVDGVNWITITSDSSGSGSGTVTYEVSPNKSSKSRSATITVAGKSHTVTQDGK
jgi:hypothetical protein